MKAIRILGSLLLGTAMLFVACGSMPAATTPLPTDAPQPPVTTEKPPETDPTPAKPITVVCVGDSITEGVGSSDASAKSYPAQLQKLLGDDYRVINCGKSKATAMDSSSAYWNTNGVAYRSTAEFQTAIKTKADIYLVMLGTNDAKNVSARFVTGQNDYKNAMNRLFDDLEAANPDAAIILVASPYRFEDMTRLRNQEQAIIPLQQELAAARNYRFLDLYTYTKEIVDSGKTINSDKLHFTDEGYAVLAAFFADALTK